MYGESVVIFVLLVFGTRPSNSAVPPSSSSSGSGSPISLLVASESKVYEMKEEKGKSELTPLTWLKGYFANGIVSNTLDSKVFMVSLNASDKVTRVLGWDWGKQNPMDIISGSDLLVSDISYDPLSTNLFWVDLNKKSIMVGSLKSRAVKELKKDLETPLSLVFIPEKNRLLLGEAGKVHIIHIKEEVEVTSIPMGGEVKVSRPSSLVYNPAMDTVFIGDSGYKAIYQWRWNSGQLSRYQDSVGEVTSMAVKGTYLYWVEKNDPTLFWSTTSSYNGQVLRKSLSFIDSRFDSIHVTTSAYASMSTSTLNTDCLSAGCSHLCFHKDGQKGAGVFCSCPFGMGLASDSLTCREHCPDHVFSCGDGQCVPLRWKCDHSPDCKNHADELQCGADEHVYGCDANTKMTCKDGGCVARSWWCDGDVDCHDGSDEGEHCPKATCPKGKFTCASQEQCIMEIWRCDGDPDCGDGSDEVGCAEVSCEESDFSCADRKMCVPSAFVCDRSHDCNDGSDERDCTYDSSLGCNGGDFTCDNNNCISQELVCNNEDDCGDGTDELMKLCHLRRRGDAVEPRKDVDCRGGFSCNGLCLPTAVQCNGTWECPDESDETNCDFCLPDTFRCRSDNRCIPNRWVCDSGEDCDDGSDEAECPGSNLSAPASADCAKDQYQCLSGECIKLGLACNQRPDCLDGSDENNAACGTACINAGCDQECQATPRGAVCNCSVGFKANEVPNQRLSCVDIDECSDQRTCSQHCLNTKGHFKCSCEEGYLLKEDGRQCRALGEEPRLFYAVGHNINAVVARADSTFRTEQELSRHDTPIRSFAYNSRTGDLFWSCPLKGVIGKVNLENKGSEVQKKEWLSVRLPEKVAVDWLTGNLYYTKQQAGSVTACNEVEASGEVVCAEVVSSVPVSTLTHLVLDPKNGRMFLAGYTRQQGDYPRGSVMQYRMDGRIVREGGTLGAGKIGIPSGLALDLFTRRVYWSDLTSRDISVCTYRGTDCGVVAVSPQHRPAHLTFFQAHLFWTTGSLGVVHSHNLVTGATDLRTELTLPAEPHSLVIVHSSLQPGGETGSCSRCSGLCLVSGQSTVRCQCQDGFTPKDPRSYECEKDNAIHRKRPFGRSSPEVSIEKIEESGVGAVGAVVAVLVIVVVLAVGGLVFFKIRGRHNKGDSPIRFSKGSNLTRKPLQSTSTVSSMGSVNADQFVSFHDDKARLLKN